MVKFAVGLFKMSPERKSITREMLAQAFGNIGKALLSLINYYLRVKSIQRNSASSPPVDLIILDEELEGLDSTILISSLAASLPMELAFGGISGEF